MALRPDADSLRFHLHPAMNFAAPRLRVTATSVLLSMVLQAPDLRAADPAAAKSAAESRPPDAAAPAKLEALTANVQVLKHEVEALQKEAAKADKPWYLDVSTIIAVASFLFAFGTTVAAARKAKSQEIESDRNELRSLLQRMAALPKENIEAQEKFAANPGALSTVAGYINQENTFLASQAAEITRRLPKGKVSAVEYYAIALGLANAYDLEGQRQFLALAVANANDFNTAIAAIRSTAFMLFQTGKPDSGRAEYQKALAIFDRYSGYDEYIRKGTHIKTEIAWAYSEFQAHAGAPAALQHLDRAEEIVQTLVPSPGRKQFEADVAQARQQLSLAGFVPKP